MKQKTLAEAIDDIERDYSFDVDYTPLDALEKIFFLKYHDQTNLTIADFIPCKDGKPLEKPKNYESYIEKSYKTYNDTDFHIKVWEQFCEEYQQALDRKIYEGFEIVDYDNYEGVECPQVSNGLITITFYPHGIFKSDDTEIKVRGDLAGIADLTDETAKKLYQ
jgi:hypothetical protein